MTFDDKGDMTIMGKGFLSAHLVPEVKKAPQGMIFYIGIKSSKNSPHKTYFDVKIITKEQAERISKLQQ